MKEVELKIAEDLSKADERESSTKHTYEGIYRSYTLISGAYEAEFPGRRQEAAGSRAALRGTCPNSSVLMQRKQSCAYLLVMLQ